MRTVTVDILNEKALNLLKDLELLKLIRVRKDKTAREKKINWQKFKGSMTKQSLDQIDQKLSEMRNEWE
ncbi:MAG: hypothetical protein R3A50_00480 [Saprospiraceae bacterium]